MAARTSAARDGRNDGEFIARSEHNISPRITLIHRHKWAGQRLDGLGFSLFGQRGKEVGHASALRQLHLSYRAEDITPRGKEPHCVLHENVHGRGSPLLGHHLQIGDEGP
jgi:hypothetical protein